MRIPVIIEDIKNHIEEKHKLILEKKNIHKELIRIKQAFDVHIYRGMKVANKKDREQDLSYMNYYKKLIESLSSIDEKIMELDKIIILKLETYFGDFVAQVKLPERINLAGDYIEKDTLFFVPEETMQGYNEVTPEDLFTLKALKTMLKPEEIKFISKKQYKE